jgi:hypothetical protein
MTRTGAYKPGKMQWSSSLSSGRFRSLGLRTCGVALAYFLYRASRVRNFVHAASARCSAVLSDEIVKRKIRSGSIGFLTAAIHNPPLQFSEAGFG